jgi:hypothetical protein
MDLLKARRVFRTAAGYQTRTSREELRRLPRCEYSLFFIEDQFVPESLVRAHSAANAGGSPVEDATAPKNAYAALLMARRRAWRIRRFFRIRVNSAAVSFMAGINNSNILLVSTTDPVGTPTTPS